MLLLILLGILLLDFLLGYRPAAAAEVLPVSIQSNRLADYSADQISSLLPVVGMGIIEDVIKDQEPTDVPARVETVRVVLQTPVPTVTPSPTPTPTTPGPTDTTAPGAPTSTPAPPASTPSFTSPPLPPATGTSSPTLMETATATLDPTKVPPTRRPTKPPTNTPSATPTPSIIPTRTSTPTPTFTSTALLCSPPDPEKGYVAYTIPIDKSKNIPVNITVRIKFNQPMYTTDLFRNIRITGTSADRELTYDPETNTLEINFLEPLRKGIKVKITIRRNIKNICQQRQGFDVKVEFETIKN